MKCLIPTTINGMRAEFTQYAETCAECMLPNPRECSYYKLTLPKAQEMKSWMTYDFFDRISGSTHWPSSDPNDSPVDTFKCKKCGYTFSMMMYGSYQAGDTPPQEHAEQKMLAHIAMFHRDGLGREPLAFAEGNPDIQPTFNFQVRDSLVGEGIRIQKCPWCADGFHESLAAEILAQYGIKIREKAEDTMARRKKEGWG